MISMSASVGLFLLKALNGWFLCGNAFEDLECRVVSEAFLRDDHVVFVECVLDGNSHWLE
jgi:hypothetical protein